MKLIMENWKTFITEGTQAFAKIEHAIEMLKDTLGMYDDKKLAWAKDYLSRKHANNQIPAENMAEVESLISDGDV